LTRLNPLFFSAQVHGYSWQAQRPRWQLCQKFFQIQSGRIRSCVPCPVLAEMDPSMKVLRFAVTALLISFWCSPDARAQQSTHTPALDVTAMDRTIDPCVDFFKYVCGRWIKNNPIPPDQSSWDLYSKMEDENKDKLRGILEAASTTDAGRSAVNQKI